MDGGGGPPSAMPSAAPLRANLSSVPGCRGSHRNGHPSASAGFRVTAWRLRTARCYAPRMPTPGAKRTHGCLLAFSLAAAAYFAFLALDYHWLRLDSVALGVVEEQMLTGKTRAEIGPSPHGRAAPEARSTATDTA